MSEYPEHDKLAAISHESQTIGEFLDWMSGQGVKRMRWDTVSDLRLCDSESRGAVVHYFGIGGRRTVDHTNCSLCQGTEKYEVTWETWVPDRRSVNEVLADYFGIDQSSLEQEKRDMLMSLRSRIAARYQSPTADEGMVIRLSGVEED